MRIPSFAPLPLRIALRQILSSSNSGFVRTVSLLSVVGIAIGVAALIILNSFMDGFSHTIMSQLSAIHPPMEISIPGEAFYDPSVLSHVRSIADSASRNVTDISPVLEKTVVAAGNSGDVAGVRMRGIDWNTEPELVSGSRLRGLNIPEDGGVIGTGLSHRLGVVKGDTVRLASTDATQFSAMGRLLVDTIVSVQVAGVVDFGIEEYNNSIVLTSHTTASALFGNPIFATSFSVGLNYSADPVMEAQRITDLFRDSYIAGDGPYMVCRAFISTHSNLFAALGLEKTAMTIVLALISVVALLNLLSALTMIAIEHRRDTGILRSMGANPGMILSVALLQGGIIGLGGAVAGSLFAVTAIHLINRYFPIRLESSVYWIDRLPGEIQPLLVLGVVAVTVIACFAASLLPALRSVRLSPSKAVRYE